MKVFSFLDAERLAAMLVGGTFVAKKIGDFQYLIESSNCCILINAQPRGGASIEVSNRNVSGGGYSFLALRHMRSATNCAHEDPASMENLAGVFNKFFPDILGGDFSNIGDYQAKSNFINLSIPRIIGLPVDDPIRVKFLNFDGSWMLDWVARQ